MSKAVKDYLLASAKLRGYYQLDPPQLNELWEISEHFIDKNRLICLEQEWYPLLEQHFFLSLLTCHDVHAKLMLKRIMEKFGVDSRRISALRTAFVRATQDPSDLAAHLRALSDIEYDAHKIGMVSLRASNDYAGFIAALVVYLEQNPEDAEAWAELAEAYAAVGDYESASSALEQVLVLEPMAYNVFARIGELQRLQAGVAISSGFQAAKMLISSSLAHLCRSVELNPAYLRGWCGVFAVSNISLEPIARDLNEKAHLQIKKLLKQQVGSPADLRAAQKMIDLAS